MVAKVSIIGAGLGGLALALALEQQSIPAEVFEMRQPSEGHIIGGAVMLSPNGLAIMDKLGVYDRIKNKGFAFDRIDFRDENYELQAHYYMGQKASYGYSALRVYRQVIIDAMKDLLQERGIPIFYGQQFRRVLNESNGKVNFETVDGETHDTTILVGADGIHSTVRGHISAVKPQYTGLTAITSAIPASAVKAPVGVSDFQLPMTIMAKRGAFVMAPQEPDGSELLVGTQFKFAELDHYGWKALSNDRSRIVSMLTADVDEWPKVVQDAMKGVTGEKINVWPFYLLPKLERWASQATVLIGDAAHALPPSAGQGTNQAMEDAYTLGLVLSRTRNAGFKLEKALLSWQSLRQARIDRVLELNAHMDKMRLPEAERKKLAAGSAFENRDNVAGEQGQLAWLYMPNLEKEIETALAAPPTYDGAGTCMIQD